MPGPSLSFCLLCDGAWLRLVEATALYYQSGLAGAGGEILVAGPPDWEGILPGVERVPRPAPASNGTAGAYMNACIARAKSDLIVIAHPSVILGPPDWPARLRDWVAPFPERLPFAFGVEVTAPSGARCRDWVRFSGERFVPLDYGERASELAVDAGVIGFSRAAWSLVGGFLEEGAAMSEAADLCVRMERGQHGPVLFCDAFWGVSVAPSVE